MINLSPGVSDPGGAVVTNLGPLRAAAELTTDGRLYVVTGGTNSAVVQITPVL